MHYWVKRYSHARIAQWNRALRYERRGRGFESLYGYVEVGLARLLYLLTSAPCSRGVLVCAYKIVNLEVGVRLPSGAHG